MSETLSQNEIDELLQKALAGGLASSPVPATGPVRTELTPGEMEALGETLLRPDLLWLPKEER